MRLRRAAGFATGMPCPDAAASAQPLTCGDDHRPAAAGLAPTGPVPQLGTIFTNERIGVVDLPMGWLELHWLDDDAGGLFLPVRDALCIALERTAARGEITSDGLEHRADLLFGFVLGLNIAVRGGAMTTEIERLMRAQRLQLDEWRSASPDPVT